MTYEQIVAMMQTYFTDADASQTTGHYAVQVNVVGEGEGAFYIEIADGNVSVQPFDYVDRNAAVFASAEALSAVAGGKVSFKEAEITVEGDENAASVLDSIKVKAAEKKAEAPKKEEKKAEVKAEAPKKEEAETKAVEAETVVEAKPAETEKPAAKTTAKKAPARKRAVSKAASNAKSTKSAKSTSAKSTKTAKKAAK